MEIVVLVALVLEVAVAVVLVIAVRRVRARMRELESAHRALEAELAGLPPTPGTNPLLSIEILNAAELAARESWAARKFGALVPRLVVREVAARAAKQMSRQLGAQGVRADIRVISPILPASAVPAPPEPAAAEPS